MMVATHGWRGSNPENMLIVPTEMVIRVAAAEDRTVFVTAGGKLYVGQYNGRDRGSLQQIELGSRCVRDATVYRGQVVFVTDAGEVFTRDLERGEVHPLPVVEPKKTCTHGQEEKGRRVRVRSVAAGSDHVLFLSAQDEIWVQGRGPALGLFTNKIENEITNPARVDFFKGRRVLQVEAGAYFTVALVEALPPAHHDHALDSDNLPDYDSYVRSCEQCRQETGDRVLFEDVDDIDKCPLGLLVRKDAFGDDRRSDLLSPAPSRSSRNSAFHEDGESSDYAPDEMDPTSGEVSCDGTTLSTPVEQRIGIEMKEISRVHKQSEGSEFEVVDCNETELDGEVGHRKRSASGSSSLFLNADAARQFISRQLSWMTSASIEQGELPSDDKFNNNKYHIDTATELIRENVASAANSAASLVATGVKTVSDKVGMLSRHFSSSEVTEGELHDMSPDSDPFLLDGNGHALKPKMSKSETFNTSSLPRRLSDEHTKKKTHARTASGGLSFPKLGKDGFGTLEKDPKQVEKNTRIIVDGGRHILNTEVWAWGSANKGQLGLGDLSHRSTPTSVATLNHMGVTKVVCGSHHTAALTIDGEVFVWGDSFGGADGLVTEEKSGKDSPRKSPGKTEDSMVTPHRLELPEGALVRDLASGDNFLVVISITGLVFYVGKLREDGKSTVEQIAVGSAATRCRSVLCQCDSIVCTSDEMHPQVISFLQEEMKYLNLLKFVNQHVVKPFQQGGDTSTRGKGSNTPHKDKANSSNDKNALIDNSQLQQTKQALLESYLDVTHAVASSINDLLDDQASDITSVIPIIRQVEEYKSIYQKYMNIVCDALAISGLSLSSREANAVIEKCPSILLNLVPEEKRKTNSDFFSHLILRPLQHIHEYVEFLMTMKQDNESYYSPFTLDKIKVAHAHWKQLSNAAHKNQVEAETTKAYWETCSPKMIEALANPSRRILRESRSNPINVHNAGRFSSHSFVLFTDVLVHTQYSNFSTYDLCTMWVEAVPNNSYIHNGIHITLPEETLTLACPTTSDKSQWMYALQEGIKRSVLTKGDPGLQVMPRAPPLIRNASHSFVKNAQYKDATYVGQWFCGKLHGEGIMTWPDGRRYEGQFRQGVYQGLGKLEVPSSGGVTVYEGMWKNGKLEGKGVIRYSNKDVYIGYLHESQPHGHGELKKGRFSSQAASVYTGEWNVGTKHGYGVLDEIVKGEKYLGMWQNNNRHGPGMVVTMNGVYYEGNFYQNKLTGYGLMMFEDKTYYEGELGASGTFAGKGTLRYPSGDSIEGTFTGSWEDGIKINGMLHKGVAAPDEENIPK
ncbi:agglutinin-like protein 2 [Halocaridina rubra]|uniref:Agglutinin-like protein 2 n=1 Tax=Halocaridina rubra TaxID=373956 RepID=A0AAN8X659_HALRR